MLEYHVPTLTRVRAIQMAQDLQDAGVRQGFASIDIMRSIMECAGLTALWNATESQSIHSLREIKKLCQATAQSELRSHK